MTKKHRKYWPQKRFRQRKTTGHQEFVNVVYLEREQTDTGERIFATCTCDQWRSSEEATTIQKVAIEAKQHVLSGPCRFRPHEVETDHPLDYVAKEAEDG